MSIIDDDIHVHENDNDDDNDYIKSSTNLEFVAIHL